MATNRPNEVTLDYAKILSDLEKIDLAAVDEQAEFKRSICGCSQNKTDDFKNTEADRQETELNGVKTQESEKFCTDLMNAESVQIVEKISKLVAELSKEDACRRSLVAQNMFPALTCCLTRADLNDEARIQLLRAMGNLCYYNDKARMDFLACGLDGLFSLLEFCTKLELQVNNSSDEEKRLKSLMVTVAIGCLHNLTNENETLRRAVYKKDVMKVLKGFVPFLRSESVLVHYGSCLENLLEMDEGKEAFVEEALMLKLYEFMDVEFLCGLGPNAEDFFATMGFLNEQKMSRVYVSESGVLSVVVEAMEKVAEEGEANLNLLRSLSMFLVSLIVNDEKPDSIFAYSDSLIVNKAIQWITEFNSDQLHIASAVIIANYLRSDEIVQKFIGDPREPLAKIISFLKKYHASHSPTLQDINLAHGFLGALRNFCVSPNSRSDVLKHDVIATCLPFIDWNNLDVKAKALGIIRLLVKSCTEKTGLDLIFSDKILESLELIAGEEASDAHKIVVGEVSRLISYLPISAKSEQNVTKLAGRKIFSSVIVDQLKSEYPIMLNEALLALNVLVNLSYGEFKEQLKCSKLNENLRLVFGKDVLPIEMRLNALKLFKFLLDKSEFFDEEELKEHLKSLKVLKTANSSNPIMVSCLTQLIDQLENFLA